MTKKQQDILNALAKFRDCVSEYKKMMLDAETAKDKYLENVEMLLGIMPDEDVTLEIIESRDDTIHYFSQARKITGLRIMRISLVDTSTYSFKTDYELFMIYPHVRFKNRKREYHYPWTGTWKLYDSKGELLLENKHDDKIIDGTYTDEELNELRNSPID